jgi:uncharacterized membrane protein YraQ (UPF0718 family)
MWLSDGKKMNLRDSFKKTGRAFLRILPVIVGTILLVSLIQTLIPKSFYTKIFTKNIFLDSFIGSLIGGISAGNPVTSYILGGELLSQEISLIAVTAFLVSWVTVGVIQIPAESYILGRKFALVRNISSFILSILVSIITVLIVRLI